MWCGRTWPARLPNGSGQRLGWNGPAVRRVLSLGVQPPIRRSSLSACRYRHALAAYPWTRRGASSSTVWPCSERGLPGRSCCHERRWSLTPPFQPYQPWQATAGGLLSVALSRGLPRVGVTHRSPLRSPDVPRRVHLRAATRPSHRPIPRVNYSARRVSTRPGRYSSSSTRTRMAPVPGQNVISSGAASRMLASSAGASAMLLASDTLPRRRAAPMPRRPRSDS